MEKFQWYWRTEFSIFVALAFLLLDRFAGKGSAHQHYQPFYWFSKQFSQTIQKKNGVNYSAESSVETVFSQLLCKEAIGTKISGYHFLCQFLDLLNFSEMGGQDFPSGKYSDFRRAQLPSSQLGRLAWKIRLSISLLSTFLSSFWQTSQNYTVDRVIKRIRVNKFVENSLKAIIFWERVSAPNILNSYKWSDYKILRTSFFIIILQPVSCEIGNSDIPILLIIMETWNNRVMKEIWVREENLMRI